MDRETLDWGEVREWVRQVALSLPPSDFASARAINAMTGAIVTRFGDDHQRSLALASQEADRG